MPSAPKEHPQEPTETRDASTSHRYKLLRVLGGGGMAVVHEVFDRVTGLRVALKRPHAGDNSELRLRNEEMFAREYHAMAQLAHPRVVEVYDYGVDEQGPYFTMELLAGGDLEQLVEGNPRRICAIARDICSALSLLHSRRIVHRDVSPRNIRCSSDGCAKLIDFGAMTRMGVTKTLVGTPVYCSPEVLSMQQLDGRADLYALGATLYYVLTGHHAYPVRDFASLPNAWRLGFARPSELVPNIPDGLDDLVVDLLQLDADSRPSSAAEVMDRLSTILGSTLQEHLLVAQSYLRTPAFIGRELELARMRSKVMRVESGRGSALLIRGCAGVGRSRFLDQGVLSAKLHGLTVIRADGDDAAVGEYGVMQRLLQQLEMLVPEHTSQLARAELPLLRQAFPHFLSAEPVAEQGELSADQLRPQLQAALVRLLRSLAERVPLMFTVDDLNTIDEPSLAALALLAREAPRAKLMLLCAAESGAIARASVPFALFAEVAQEFSLSNLSLHETRLLLGSVFGTSPQLEALAASLHPLSSGSPRDLMRLAQHLVERGLVRYQNGAWTLPAELDTLELPASVTQLLLSRVSSLDASARDLACALALCPDKSFSFEECLRLSNHEDPRRLLADLDQLTGFDIVRASNTDSYVLADRAWVSLLHGLHSADGRMMLHLRLASIFDGRSGEEFRHAQQLLRGGKKAEAVSLLAAYSRLSVEQTDHDSNAFVRFVQALPLDWADTYEEMLEARRALGRPKAEEHAMHLRIVGLLGIGLRGKSPLPEMLAQFKADCGLLDWEQLDPGMEPGARLMRAFELARTRYDALAEHERLFEPLAALKALAVVIRYTIATAAPSFSVDQLRCLPSLQPLAALAPVLGFLELLRTAVLARMTGRFDDTLRLYSELLDKAAEPGHCGLDEVIYQTMRSMLLSSLSMIEAGLGLPRSVERVAAIEQNPFFAINAVQLQLLDHLWQGNRRAAAECRTRLSVLRLQNTSRQYFESGHLVWQLMVHVAAEDLSQLKHALREIEPMARQFPGWQPVLAWGRIEEWRMRGEYAHALQLLESLHEQFKAGDHQLWVQLAAAEVSVLDAAGRSAEAVARGVQHLAALEAARLGPIARNCLLLPLAVAQARANDPAAVGTAEAALEHVQRLGATGINLFLAYEARAWVAALQRDRAGFERYYTLCEQQTRQLSISAIGAKIKRLQREAQRVQLIPNVPLTGPGTGTAAGETVFRSQLHRCACAEERARVMLAQLARQSGAAGGLLFVVTRDGAPTFSAQLNDREPGIELVEMARQYLAAELSEQDFSTDAPETSVKTSWPSGDEQLYRPVLLSHYDETGYVITGLAVLRSQSGRSFVHPAETASRVSRALCDVGDSTGVCVTEIG